MKQMWPEWYRQQTDGTLSANSELLADHRSHLDAYVLSNHMNSSVIGSLEEKETALQQALQGLEDVLKEAKQNVTEGHTEATGELARQTEMYDLWATQNFKLQSKTICEIGFNAGHSALRFLSQSDANVIEFDNGAHPYARLAASYLRLKYGHRLQMIFADSKNGIPYYHNSHQDVRCNLLILDGARNYDDAYNDLGNFQMMASKDHIVTMDDTPCSASYCAGPTQAWRELVDWGCIKELKAIPMGADRGFSTGQYVACPLWPDF